MKILVPPTGAAGLPVAAMISRIIQIPAVTPVSSSASTCDPILPGKSLGAGR